MVKIEKLNLRASNSNLLMFISFQCVTFSLAIVVAVVNANSLGRFNNRIEKIDEISDRHNAIDQTKGGDLRPVLSGRNSEEQELVFPASPEQYWIPSYASNNKLRYDDSGIKTHRIRREYGVKSTYGSHDSHLEYGKHNVIENHRPIGGGYADQHHSGYGGAHDSHIGYGQHNAIHPQPVSGIKYPEHHGIHGSDHGLHEYEHHRDHEHHHDHHDHHQAIGSGIGHHDSVVGHHGSSYGHSPTDHHGNVYGSLSHHSTEVGQHGSGYGRKY